MIILDITDESGVSFYEILEFKPDLLTGLDEKQAAKKIRDAANKARKPYSKAAQRGDKEAEERLARVNEAETALKKADDRSRYDEQFQNSPDLRSSGCSPSLRFFSGSHRPFRAIRAHAA